jgi:RNA polymerase sigma factor (sigma-70 family)
LTTQVEISKLIDHLFRYESGKMIAVLTRIFGSKNLDLAEDVVQDSLIEAIKIWTYKGIPDNPTAWLFKVAKNKALNIINREKYQQQYSSDIAHFLKSEWTAESAFIQHFSEDEILDDQLRMMFTCCHPSLSSDSQIALILKTLCGFNVSEIARAFLTTEDNISKRLVRARKKIREEKIPFEIPYGIDLEKRLQTVLESTYLLFNEGYNASTGAELIRSEICEDAIRLAEIVANHASLQGHSEVYALLSLMQLNASRFKARQDNDGNILTLEKQNRKLWDYSLMEKGFSNLQKSTSDNQISAYHLLASISSFHCSAVDYNLTDWQSILSLYNKLIKIDGSPIVLLNRAVAISKASGVKDAISELAKIEDSPSLKSYHLYYSVKAEFLMELNQHQEAVKNLYQAIVLASLQSEKLLLQGKIDVCLKKIN